MSDAYKHICYAFKYLDCFSHHHRRKSTNNIIYEVFPGFLPAYQLLISYYDTKFIGFVAMNVITYSPLGHFSGKVNTNARHDSIFCDPSLIFIITHAQTLKQFFTHIFTSFL